MIRTFLTASVLFLACSTGFAGEETPGLEVTADITFTSKYIWRGYNILGEHGAVQPSLDVDLFGTGFSANVWASYALSSGLSDFDEMDFTLAYETSVFEDKRYAMDIVMNYIYYEFPNLRSAAADTEEVGASVSMPSLLPLGGSSLVPSYYVGRLFPADEGGPTGGIFHIAGLSYSLTMPVIGGKERTIDFTAEAVYNDGAFDADSDWSHATFGVSTQIDVGPLYFTPFLNYQLSMSDTVNEDDEIWGGLSVSYNW